MSSEGIIGTYGGYRSLLSFTLVNLIVFATRTFCCNNYSYRNDALGKMRGQMEGAARSARQNIVEGSSRAGTSGTTEIRLTDVAKASLEELAGDYESHLCYKGLVPWRGDCEEAQTVSRLTLEKFVPGDRGNLRYDYGVYIAEVRKRFAPWLENADDTIAANAILIIIDRACALLAGQLKTLARNQRENGGFTERVSRVRKEYRDRPPAEEEKAPACPKCGKPMIRRHIRTGSHAGSEFWGCSAYPACHGTRPCDAKHA